MVSPGLISACMTAALACAPECGCTLANSGAEQGLDSVDRQLLDDVDVLAAAVVAPARVALGVLVGQHRALCLHDGERRMVLRGDHLQAVALALRVPCRSARRPRDRNRRGVGREHSQVAPFVRPSEAPRRALWVSSVLNTRLSITDISECDRYHSWSRLWRSRVAPWRRATCEFGFALALDSDVRHGSICCM